MEREQLFISHATSQDDEFSTWFVLRLERKVTVTNQTTLFAYEHYLGWDGRKHFYIPQVDY